MADRIDRFGLSFDPAGIVAMMLIEERARTHATAEGAPDPYPLPPRARARREAADRARREHGGDPPTTLSETPRGVPSTTTRSGGKSSDGDCTRDPDGPSTLEAGHE